MKKPRTKRNFIRYFPVYGCIATGIVYVAIGIIALLSFFKIRDGGADESSMLGILNDYLVGKFFIAIILSGSVCYIIWRMYEAITDPYQYGSTLKGSTKRIGIALSTVADIIIVYTAVRVLLGVTNVQVNGQPDAEREMIGELLQSWGNWIVLLIGSIVLLTAAIQFMYGVTKGYIERLDIDHCSRFVRGSIHGLAWSGYFARGIILGITGFFLTKAGVIGDSQYVVNTDKAFDFIGDNVGHVYFILVAIGTICYGLFMGAQAIWYDPDGD